MKYRKLNKIPMQGNSERSLVLRQQWALAFLRQDLSQKIVLNVDETWLGMSDFRRRKWQAPGSNNSVRALSMVPRVTMLAGVNTLGSMYISLAQSNSNRQMMSIFLQQLVKRLGRERPNWRADTIILHDGASYWACEETYKLLKALQVPAMTLGPYSYSACLLYTSPSPRD